MGQRSVIISIIIVVFAVILVMLFILSRLTSPAKNDQKSAKSDSKTAVKFLVNTADIISDPLVYDGLTVDAESSINDWVTKRAFTVSATSQGLFGTQSQLLVISKTTFKLPKTTTDTNLGLGETVQVRLRGRVRIMDRVELGRALGLPLDGSDIALDDNNIANWDEGSVLLLHSVEKLQK